MADIVKAIETEKIYLEHRMRNEYPFHLVDKIKECGFTSLGEYFEVKKNYEFSNLPFEPITTTPTQAIADVLKVLNREKIALLFADTLTTFVWNGDNSQFNTSYCLTHGIPVFPIQTKGGTIVSTKGDLSVGICFPRSINIGLTDILNGFVNIFRKHTDKEVIVNGNDIIVDGYKVLGSTSYATKTMFMFVALVSLSEKTELINNICLKQSNKLPGYIDFMTAEVLKREVSEWLHVQ